jgi:uncharacterized protein YceK
MSRLVTIAMVCALALVGCGGAKHTSASKSPCLFTEAGAKLCAHDAVSYCQRYGTISNGCDAVLVYYDRSHGKGWEARLLENLSAATSKAASEAKLIPNRSTGVGP